MDTSRRTSKDILGFFFAIHFTCDIYVVHYLSAFLEYWEFTQPDVYILSSGLVTYYSYSSIEWCLTFIRFSGLSLETFLVDIAFGYLELLLYSATFFTIRMIHFF